tara:strand:- start:9841 stop:10176 length:336 start_codon:yes stop_codon:yes gene_type:complete
MQITLPAVFDNLSFLKDGSVKLKFESGELSSTDLMMLLGYRNTQGWLAFSPNKELKIPEEEANLDLKSPSELLRDALYVRFKEKNIVGTFQTYYNEKMEQIRQGVLKDVKK